MSDKFKKLLDKIPSYKRRMLKMHQQVVEFVVEGLERRGWQKQYLAELMKVKPESLSRSLSYGGTANLTLETIAKIGDAFGEDIFVRRNEVLEEVRGNFGLAHSLYQDAINHIIPQSPYFYQASRGRRELQTDVRLSGEIGITYKRNKYELTSSSN